jgi:hypothetical protein
VEIRNPTKHFESGGHCRAIWPDWLPDIRSGAERRYRRPRVALARIVFAQDDLASGRMLPLFSDVTWPSALAYFVVYWKECASVPKLVAFCEWLLNEAATQSNCDISRPSASHQMTAL